MNTEEYQLKRANLRALVRGTYDLQHTRIIMGNRLFASFRARLGLKPNEAEEKSVQAKKVLDSLRADFNKITDGVKKEIPAMTKFQPGTIISTYTELCLVAEYVEIETNEEKHFRRLASVLTEFPIYNEFLSGIRGIGPAMAGVILSEFDITKAIRPSHMWSYAGLAVEADGRGTSSRKEHFKLCTKTNRDGEIVEYMGIRHNRFLKTKLVGVLASSFLRSGSEYRVHYDNYINRLHNHPTWSLKTKGHRHNAAIRYMIKIFLLDLYAKWRAIEGLPISAPYHEAKLGLRHAA